jgi:hypothetical protein
MKVYKVQIIITAKAVQSYKVEADGETEAKEKVLDRVREEYAYDLSSIDLYDTEIIEVKECATC